MKYLKFAALASILSSGLSYAGTAYIPEFSVWNGAASCYTISNVSNVQATVTVRFYKKDGTAFAESSGDSEIFEGDFDALGTQFYLEAHKTAGFCLRSDSAYGISGYGVIESSSSNGNQPFLVATGRYQATHTASTMVERSISIHQGMPF